MKLAVAIAAHIGSIVLANILTDRFGLVPVWPGLVVTAGTYAAGFALLARDLVHRYGGPAWALASIAVGAALSWLMASPALAAASFVAFTLAEVADLLVYTPLRRRSFTLAALASNAVGAPIDTVVFLSLAGFGLAAPVVIGQLIGKLLWATALPLLVVWMVRRALLRQPVNPAGA